MYNADCSINNYLNIVSNNCIKACVVNILSLSASLFLYVPTCIFNNASFINNIQKLFSKFYVNVYLSENSTCFYSLPANQEMTLGLHYIMCDGAMIVRTGIPWELNCPFSDFPHQNSLRATRGPYETKKKNIMFWTFMRSCERALNHLLVSYLQIMHTYKNTYKQGK